MENVQGLEWPETRLGPLCPGKWVEEIDPEDLPGEFISSEAWWADARDKGDELADHLTGQEALDARLSQEMARSEQARCRNTRVQWSTDKVTRAFFQVRDQRGLDNAFALLQRIEDRHRICQGVIDLAVKRVVRLGRETHQRGVDNLRELNEGVRRFAAECGWRLPPEVVPTETKSLEGVRQQAWCVYQPKGWPAGTWKLGRGKELRPGAVVAAMSERQILATLQELVA